MDLVPRRRALGELAAVLVIALLVIEVLVWRQTRPDAPAGAVPVSGTQQLVERHGCRVPPLWGAGEAAGALIGSVDPARPRQVAWVGVTDVGRWQPAWQVQQWCTR